MASLNIWSEIYSPEVEISLTKQIYIAVIKCYQKLTLIVLTVSRMLVAFLIALQ